MADLTPYRPRPAAQPDRAPTPHRPEPRRQRVWQGYADPRPPRASRAMREDDWASEPTYSAGGASPARRYYAASEPLEPWPLAEWLVQHLIPFAKKAARWAGRQVWRAACWSWPVVCRLAGRVRRAAIEAPRRPQLGRGPTDG